MFIKKLKLRFGDRVAVLNDFFYQNRREYFFQNNKSAPVTNHKPKATLWFGAFEVRNFHKGSRNKILIVV
jgi:hypothetical protein